MIRAGGWLCTAALLLGGCAGSKVTLLPGENGADVGAVAILNADGSDRAVIDSANERARVRSRGMVRPKALSEARISDRYGQLIADIPPPPSQYTLNFLEDSTVLTAASEDDLGRLLAEIPTREGSEVQIIGHTDTLGSDAENDVLALDRARQIKAVLLERGVADGLIRVSARGEREPIVRTGDGVRNGRNRRVEVLVR